MTMMLSDRRPILLANARIVDPSRNLDIVGDLLIAEGVVREAKKGIGAAGVPEGTHVIDCRGKLIAPGLIDTPIYGEGEASEAFKAKLGESVLFPKRLGVPDELASMVVECVTNSYMNAEVIRVDGGIRMPPK